MRRRVRCLDGQAIRHPLGDICLQSVVHRRCGIGEQLYVQEGVVIDGVERQSASLGTDPKVVKLQSGWFAVEWVPRHTESLQLSDESRLGRIAIYDTEQSGTLRSHVIQFQYHIACQFVLDPEVPP